MPHHDPGLGIVSVASGDARDRPELTFQFIGAPVLRLASPAQRAGDAAGRGSRSPATTFRDPGTTSPRRRRRRSALPVTYKARSGSKAWSPRASRRGPCRSSRSTTSSAPRARCPIRSSTSATASDSPDGGAGPGRLRGGAVKLLTKLTLLALAVSALPVAIAGYSSLRIGQGALRGALEQNELTVAKQVAGYASSHIENMLSMLRVDARILDLTRSAQNEPPSPQALNQVLWLVYHQNDDFCAVAMFDEHGALIGKPASLEDPSRYESLKNHEPMRPTDVEGVGLMAPLGRRAVGGTGHRPDLPGRAAAAAARRAGGRVRSRATAAASASWPPRCRSSGWRTTSRRCRRPTSTSSCSTAAAGCSRPGRARASTSWSRSACPARARASCRRARSSPSTSTAAGT